MSTTKVLSITLETNTLTFSLGWEKQSICLLQRMEHTLLAQILIPPLLQGRREEEENQRRVGTETVVTGTRSRPTAIPLILEPLHRGISTMSSLQAPAQRTSRGLFSSTPWTQRSCRDSCKSSCRGFRKQLERYLAQWASLWNNNKISLWLISWPPSYNRSHHQVTRRRHLTEQ